ncbi:MAG TPA: type II secretion system protein GspJ [Polyangiaceae bacterium]|nr:type II secretion system protein GspJ [Polyangiaceae bacterium]
MIRRRALTGFTLLEVMIAIGVLAMITVLLYGAFSGLKQSKDTIERIDGRYHEGRAAIHRMSSELQSAYLSLHLPIDPQLQVVATSFVGKRDSPADRVDFNTFANQRYERDSHKSDQAEIGYFGMADPEDSSRFDLVRRISDRPDLQPTKGGRIEVLATDIEELKFTYLDPTTGQWLDEWDSTQALEQNARLPLQIKIRLVLKGGRKRLGASRPDDIEFMTKVDLPIQNPLAFAR